MHPDEIYRFLGRREHEDGSVTFDMERPGAGADCTLFLPKKHAPARAAFVNAGPEHMPEGLASHLDHLRRLAMRGEKDES